VATFELALAVHPSSGVRTAVELTQWFAVNPRAGSIGVPAAGSAPELLAISIARKYKADIVPVAYKGAAPLVQDLLGGQITAGVAGISDFLQYHPARLRILAVTRQTPLLPDVPAFAQAGIPDLDLTDLLGLYAPAATPTGTIARYNAALRHALGLPEVVEKLRAVAMTPLPTSPDEHGQQLQRITRNLATLVRSTGYAPQ
jgi:tripartite-type tricarboxylate transporter receptor subunit TctC